MIKLLTVWIKTNWKILKEMEIPDHLTSLLSNQSGSLDLLQVKKQHLEADQDEH